MTPNVRQAVLSRLNEKTSRLSTGDLERLVKFAEALLVAKTGKRQQRSKRMSKPAISVSIWED